MDASSIRTAVPTVKVTPLITNLTNKKTNEPKEPRRLQAFATGVIPACRSLMNLAGDPLFINSSSWVGARAVAGLTRVGILLAIARAYGPAKFGELSLAISIVEILRIFSEFGVDTISIRKFAQVPPDEKTGLLGGILGAKLLMATCSYCLGACMLLFIADGGAEVQLGAVAGLSLFFAGALGALSSYLQSSFSMYRLLRTTLLTSGVSICFAAAAIVSKASLLWVILALPLADSLNLFLLWRKLDVPLHARFSVRETTALLRESLPVGLTAVSVILYFRVDNLFVFKFAGEAALGLYAVCYRIIEPALMVPSSFATTGYALLSSADYQSAGIGKVSRVLLRTMWPAYAFIATTAMVFLFAGRLLLARFFSGYQAAYPILLVLLIVLSVRTLNATLVAVLNSRAKYSILARITAANLAINLLLVVVLVPRWGALGAAWAAVLTETLSTLMQAQSIIYLLLPVGHALVAENLNVE